MTGLMVFCGWFFASALVAAALCPFLKDADDRAGDGEAGRLRREQDAFGVHGQSYGLDEGARS